MIRKVVPYGSAIPYGMPIARTCRNGRYPLRNVDLSCRLYLLEYQANLMHMDPVIVASARKHGIPDTDLLHAYRNPIRVFKLDDLVMLIGGDESGRMLESASPPPKASSSSSMQCLSAASS